jgi:tRNA pseudouridine38-40 synthase
MQRLLLTLRYDGTAYHGWQVQPNGITVQQALQDAVEAVTGVRAGIIGCSRTDAGVHADMFCCTFDTDSLGCELNCCT